MGNLEFDPRIPLGVWVPLLLASVASLAAYLVLARGRLRARRLALVGMLMAVAMSLPLAVLLNPTWVERIPPPAGKPLLTVLIDSSASMATRDLPRSESRYQAAVQAYEQLARQVGGEFDVRVRTFDTRSQQRTPDELRRLEPDGEGTNLAAALEAALDDRPQGQAILLLSDGIHNTGGGAAELRRGVEKARAMAAPVYAVSLGSDAVVDDLEVRLETPSELAFLGQTVTARVAVHQRGRAADRARLQLLLDDQVIEQQDLPLSTDRVETTFAIQQSETGLYRYEVRVEPAPREVITLNNSAALMLRVVDEPVRILLLEGKPYWDTKFLIRTLVADPSVELDSVVRMAAGRFLHRRISRVEPDGDEATESSVRDEDWKILDDPAVLFTDAQALAKYQIVILGRDSEVYLTDAVLDQLKRWLAEKDGSLVCSRGAPTSQVNERLGALMPVRWTAGSESRFRVKLTESGQALRWLPAGEQADLLADLPSLAAVARAERPKPLAVVLATQSGERPEETPVITYQPIGNGRVVVVEGAGMWRWAFLPAQYQQHDQTYGELWRSLVRWLVSNVSLLPSQQMALRSDKVTFSTSETATATLVMRESGAVDEVPLVELTGESLSDPRPLRPVPSGASPGQFRVVFGKLPEGKYQARVSGADEAAAVAAFDVRGNLHERLEIAARPDLLRMVASESGGAMLESADSRDLVRKFREHLDVALPRRTVRTTAWDRWWVLAGVFALWVVSWATRRSSGMI